MEIDLPYNYVPRLYQRQLFSHFVPDSHKKRAVVIAHRRWGKDLLCVNIAACLTQQRVGTYWHVLPYAKQARAVVWNGKMKEGRAFRDYFHPKLVSHSNENEMRIHMKNQSIWQCIGGDDIDRHVGTNPIGVVLSEWALLDPRVLDYIRPILRENDGWCLMITTIRGKNHAYRSALKASKLMEKNPNWLYVNQTVDDTKREDGTPVFSKEDLDAEREEGMSEEMIQQEYYNSADAPVQGAYYARELALCHLEKRVCSIPWEPKLPVHTYWDLGYGDFTVILFVQFHNLEIRVIDRYAASGETMGHYKKKLDEKPYHYGEHYAPWDVEIKDLKSDGKSVYDIAKGMGIRFRVTPQPKRVEDGIEQVRNIFPRLWFDKVKCERHIEAISGYSKEAIAEKLQPSRVDGEEREIMYKDKPLHSWHSHDADALRVLAWNVKKKKDPSEKDQEYAEDSYNYV